MPLRPTSNLVPAESSPGGISDPAFARRFALELRLGMPGFVRSGAAFARLRRAVAQNEACHGVGRNGRATVFPQVIGLGATWNRPLVDRVASTIADALQNASGSRSYRVQGQSRNGYVRENFKTFVEANCRRQVTITTAAVDTNKSQGLTNQPR